MLFVHPKQKSKEGLILHRIPRHNRCICTKLLTTTPVGYVYNVASIQPLT